MSDTLQNAFMKEIQENEAIIHKVIGLYVDVEEDKRDLYQEVLLQAWKSYSNFKRASKFSTWLYKLSLNTVFSFTKKVRKNTTQEITAKNIPMVMPTKDYEILYWIIKKLNKVDRMIMSLHLDGYKNTEIAEVLGIDPNHLNVKIHRIKGNVILSFKKIHHA